MWKNLRWMLIWKYSLLFIYILNLIDMKKKCDNNYAKDGVTHKHMYILIVYINIYFLSYFLKDL